MIGPLTGHCHLKKHLFEVGLTDSSGCDRCEQATETTMHCGCEALATLRFGQHFMKSDDLEDISIALNFA